MGFWINFAIAIALQVASYLLAPKPKTSHRAAAERFEVPGSQEGQPIPILFGTRKIRASHVAWYGDIKTEAIKRKGGKK